MHTAKVMRQRNMREKKVCTLGKKTDTPLFLPPSLIVCVITNVRCHISVRSQKKDKVPLIKKLLKSNSLSFQNFSLSLLPSPASSNFPKQARHYPTSLLLYPTITSYTSKSGNFEEEVEGRGIVPILGAKNSRGSLSSIEGGRRHRGGRNVI